MLHCHWHKCSNMAGLQLFEKPINLLMYALRSVGQLLLQLFGGAALSWISMESKPWPSVVRVRSAPVRNEFVLRQAGH